MIDPLSMCNLKGNVCAAVVVTSHNSGEPITTYNVSQSNVPFGFRQLSAAEAVRFDRESARRMYGAVFLPTADIAEEDRFTFGTRTFEVNSIDKVYDDQTGAVALIAAVLEETV